VDFASIDLAIVRIEDLAVGIFRAFLPQATQDCQADHPHILERAFGGLIFIEVSPNSPVAT
jgi:hypothetical protein